MPFNPKELLYYDYNGLPDHLEKKVGVRRVNDLKEFVAQCDLVTVNAPLHEGTKGLINADLLKHFKKVLLPFPRIILQILLTYPNPIGCLDREHRPWCDRRP